MKLLTAELTGKPLDWALAKAKGLEVAVSFDDDVIVPRVRGGLVWVKFKGHTDPALCLGLIEDHVISIDKNMPVGAGNGVGGWRVFPKKGVSSNGSTVAEAVARCVVAMHLGDEVDVPDELCEQRKEGV